MSEIKSQDGQGKLNEKKFEHLIKLESLQGLKPNFKNRDEYLKWKAQRLENIRELESEDIQYSKPFQPLPSNILNRPLLYPRKQMFGWVILFIGFLIFVFQLSYIKELITKKSWPDIIQEAKKAVVVIKTSNSTGSGFLISPDGLIITNSHVIQNDSDVNIFFNSKEQRKASIIKKGIEPLDIAIVKVTGDNYDYLTLADSNNCKAGEEVLALGAPKKFSETVTKGIVSNCNRQLMLDLPDIKYIQTDTPINPGNSGGPLINIKGEVIGIVTGKTKDIEGINFAIVSNVVKDFKDGTLLALEETVRKMEEARLHDEKQNEEKFIELFTYTFNLLNSTWKNEYNSYYNRVVQLVEMRKLSIEQGNQLLQRVSLPPQGFSSLNNWLVALATRILLHEITFDEATNLIRSSFVN